YQLSAEGIRPAIVSGFKVAEAIDLLDVPTTLRSSTLNRSPKNATLIWFGPVAWPEPSISLQELLIERASNSRCLLS
ncbi:hypothetical protein, partial [Microcoleus sp. herbarium5]|uniref:hypothetical protein n=1 Tax=Microcoleus sp. herbarium5 TaxID=3055434 RepID=UPI002FD76652